MNGLWYIATNSSATTVGSVQVLSPVVINGCQVSLLRGFHLNSSLETAEGLVASRKAGALPMQTAPRERWEKGREWGTALYWFYTHAHATADQSVGIAPDTWHVANKQTSMEGWEWAREWDWQREREDARVQWMMDNRLMGRSRCNGVWSGRPQETVRETIWLSTHHSFLSNVLSLCLSFTLSVGQLFRLTYSHANTVRSREIN